MNETLDDILFGRPEAIHGRVIADGGSSIVVEPPMDVKEMDLLKIVDTGELLVVTKVLPRNTLNVTRGFGKTSKAYATRSIVIVIGSLVSWE